MWDILQLSIREYSKRTAIVLFTELKEEILLWCRDNIGSSGWVINWLREWIDSLVVLWVRFLGLSGNVPDLFSPSINWSGPVAITLNGNVVCTSAHTEETLLTPVRTPGVSDSPELLTILYTVADNGNSVHDLHVTGGVAINSASVVFERLGNCNSSSNWSALVDFLQHSILAFDSTELVNVVDSVLGWDNASLAWAAVSANLHS